MGSIITPVRKSVIYAFGGILAGTGSLFAQSEGQQEDFDSATFVSAQVTLVDSISPVGDIDTYTFTIDTPQQWTGYTTGPVDTFGCLFNGSGSLVVMDNNGGLEDNCRLSSVLQPGTYFFQVSSWHAQDTGNYQLRFETEAAPGGGGDENPGGGQTIEDSAPLEPNSTVTGSIAAAGEADYYQINLGVAQTLTMSTSGSFDTYGHFLNAEGVELMTNDDGGTGLNFLMNYTAQPGTYYLKVRAWSPSATGDYTLHVSSDVETTRLIAVTSALDFGTVQVAQRVGSVLAITNTGTSFLDVTGLTMPEGFSGDWSGEIAPGGTEEVSVTFEPMTSIEHRGVIEVQSNSTNGIATVNVRGKGSSATNPSMSEEYHNARYVSGNGTQVASGPLMIRLDVPEDAMAKIETIGFFGGTGILHASDARALDTYNVEVGQDLDLSLALPEGTYYFEFSPSSDSQGFLVAMDTTTPIEPVAVQRVAVSGEERKDLELEFLSYAGVTYKLQANTGQAEWSDLETGILGTGSPIWAIDRGAAKVSHCKFYRFVEMDGSGEVTTSKTSG